jgi:endonuclease G
MKKILILCLISFTGFGQAENISNANLSDKHNYFLPKLGYTLSYNDSLHHANWVRWTLVKTDIGSTERQNDFRPDVDLPKGFYKVLPSDYSQGGYDRGHLCNSQARTSSVTLNEETFLMSNMIPQHPRCNRGSWKHLEDQCQSWVRDNNEKLTIYAGYFGSIGTLKHGVSIPAQCWKVIYGHGLVPICIVFENDESEKFSVVDLSFIEKQTGYTF